MSTGTVPSPWYREAIAAYDWLYRAVHGLNTSTSAVGPILRLVVRRSYRTVRLADGTLVRFGDRVGFLHLNNERVVGLQSDGLSPLATGLEFRRLLIASLRALATLVGPGGRFGTVRAFAAITIFHQGLCRLGFEAEDNGLRWPRLVAAYQRALLTSLRDGRPVSLRGATYHHAERVWISGQTLVQRYGARHLPPG